MTHLLQVTEDHSIYNTGITTALDGLIRQLAHQQDRIQQSLIYSGGESIPVPEGVSTISLVPSRLGRVWRYAPGANLSVLKAVKQADVVHLHGIWMWIQWVAANIARQQGKPFALSVHGMLEPWIWERQHWIHRLKKSLYWNLVAYPIFRFASLIHAVNDTEAVTLQSYFNDKAHPGGNPKIEIIPHSLDLEMIDLFLAKINPHITSGNINHTAIEGSSEHDPYILFLGRLHPVKGIDLLIKAFANLDVPRLKLKVAGFTEAREAAYATYLRELVSHSGLSEKVEFLGAVQGEHKWELVENAWVFCLPSHTEVIGMANLESAACRTPVITTYATGVGKSWTENGGILVEPDSMAITQALTQALHWSVQERIDRGKSLRKLVETTYSWSATAERWTALYERLAATKWT